MAPAKYRLQGDQGACLDIDLWPVVEFELPQRQRPAQIYLDAAPLLCPLFHTGIEKVECVAARGLGRI